MEIMIMEDPFEPDDILDILIEKWEKDEKGMTLGEMEDVLKKTEPTFDRELLEAYLEKLTDDRSLMSWKGKYYPFRALRKGLSEEIEGTIMEGVNRYNKTRIKNIDPGYFKEHHGISQGALNWVVRKMEREKKIMTFSRTVNE